MEILWRRFAAAPLLSPAVNAADDDLEGAFLCLLLLLPLGRFTAVDDLLALAASAAAVAVSLR